MSTDNILQFPKSFHFGGGAWAASFHIGVIKALEEQWEEVKKKSGGSLTGELCTNIKVSGDSVGAAIGAGLQLGMTWKELRSLYLRLAKRARTSGVWCGRMSTYHEEMLDCILKNPESVELLEQRGFAMGVTRFFNRYQKYTSWRDMKHLRECIHSTMHIPLYCAYKSGVDGMQAIDGGFSATSKNLEHIDCSIGQGPTFNISMVPTMSEIVFPPSDEEVDRKIVQGYAATMAWERGSPPLETTKGGGNCFMIFVLFFRTIHYIFHSFETLLCVKSGNKTELIVCVGILIIIFSPGGGFFSRFFGFLCS